jgi:hypothetical protein
MIEMMTLNGYIVQNAGSENDPEFLRRFAATEVFFSIDVPSADLKDGPLTNSPGFALQMQSTQLDIGRMGLFYTTKSDPRLSHRFAGLPLIKAAEMISEMAEVEGMLIQSDGSAWFAADKQILKKIIGQVRSRNFDST